MNNYAQNWVRLGSLDPGPGNDPQDLDQAGAAELTPVEVARPAPPAEV